MITFFSGSGGGSKEAQPEHLFGKETNVMMTFANFRKKMKPDKRFRKMVRYRRNLKAAAKK